MEFTTLVDPSLLIITMHLLINSKSELCLIEVFDLILDHPYMDARRGRHDLDPECTNLAAVGSVAGDIRVTTDVGQNPGAAPGMGEVVRESLKAVQTMAAQVKQLNSGVVGLPRGGR